MKKLFILTLMVLCTGIAFAQLKVDSVGSVTIGLHSYDDTDVSLSGQKGKALYIYQNKSNGVNFGIRAYSQSQQTNGFTGIDGEAGGNHFTSVIAGVRGHARGNLAATGIPIGVFGNINTLNTTTRGAGVFGSTTAQGATSIDGLYAGYFNGQTKINGNFIVTGNIQGTILGAPAASSGSTLEENMEERYSSSVITSLRNLKANSFYKEIPEETLKAMNLNNASSQSKTIQIENMTDEEMIELEAMDKEAIPEISAIEKQILTKQHYGLSAEELEEVFPDLVYDNEDGTKSINYVEMVPILVQAINELSAKLEVLEGKDGTIKKVKAQTTNVDEIGGSVTLLSLGQNKPNPFGTSTSIEVSIPEDVQSAFIYVYDLTGKKLQQMDVVARGRQTISLNASSLTDGMYLYSLIADGKVVETRRMIVEK